MKRATIGLMLAAALALPVSMLPATSASARVRIGISVGFGPPSLPWYPQPYCPGYGYYWVPGYWAWGPYGYFWVPGAWVWPPVVGFLWTPGWWGWYGGRFWWHSGYWGRHVGFYGGIAYGHGYNGHGYHGGRWHHGRFHYNRAVTNLKPSMLHGSYNRTAAAHPVSRNDKRISYNGGKGGVNLLPTSAQKRLAHEDRLAPTHMQTLNLADARQNPAMRFANNHGRPVVATRPSLHPTGPAPADKKPTNRLAKGDPASSPINALDSLQKRPPPKQPAKTAVRIAPRPVLVARPQPAQPADNPHRQPVVMPRPRPAQPPTRAPHNPDMTVRPRPIHPMQPHPVIAPRPRPAQPPRAGNPPQMRPPPRLHPPVHARPMPAQQPVRAPHVERHIAPVHRQGDSRHGDHGPPA